MLCFTESFLGAKSPTPLESPTQGIFWHLWGLSRCFCLVTVIIFMIEEFSTVQQTNLKQFNFSVTMASKILKMGSRVIFWVGEPPQKFFSKSEGVGEIMLFYFNFDPQTGGGTFLDILLMMANNVNSREYVETQSDIRNVSSSHLSSYQPTLPPHLNEF